MSDHDSLIGAAAFIRGLTDLGYSPTTLQNRPDHVVIDYTVETGRFAGRLVRLGFIVPADFPATSPSGPHVSPRFHPNNPGGAHPTGGIHEPHSQPFQQGAGGEWQYWSRPFATWATSKRTVAAYMSHIWRLWDSQ